jgi:hypothetical protein
MKFPFSANPSFRFMPAGISVFTAAAPESVVEDTTTGIDSGSWMAVKAVKVAGFEAVELEDEVDGEELLEDERERLEFLREPPPTGTSRRVPPFVQ